MARKKSLMDRVTKAMDKIRPFLKADGGDVTIVEITENKIVKIKLLGTCQDCPMNLQTLKGGIELVVKNEVPEIKAVEPID